MRNKRRSVIACLMALGMAVLAIPAASAASATETETKQSSGQLAPLEILPIDDFNEIYNDRGTGADDDVSIWRPYNVTRIDTSGRATHYYRIGYVAMGEYDNPPKNAFLVRDAGDALAKPVDFRRVWTDEDSGGDMDGSLWHPIAPAGYSCLGDVAMPNYDEPENDVVRCVKTEYTVQGEASWVWDDSGSGADENAGVWQVDPASSEETGLTSSTFVATNGDSGSDWRYRVLNMRYTNLPTLQRAQAVDSESTAKAYAPMLTLAAGEKYNPSSVDFFRRNTHREGDYLVTNEPLGCDSCTDPVFLDGQDPNSGMTTYAEVVPKTSGGEPTDTVDVIYWQFYPYNAGKRICLGIETSFCLGGWATFGNHVGDWEHLTVRFRDNYPHTIGLSTHSSGSTYPYGTKHIRLDDWQPHVYVAHGSHGLYADKGKHVYKSLPNGSELADETSEGTEWDYARELNVFHWQQPGTYPSRLNFMNLGVRWGNPASGCEVVESVSGECVLNPGPTGPDQKDFAQPPLGPVE